MKRTGNMARYKSGQHSYNTYTTKLLCRPLSVSGLTRMGKWARGATLIWVDFATSTLRTGSTFFC